VLTIGDVKAIPLFADMAADDLRRLVETSADMQLAPGEFAVPEGGERALFAVLAGRIEVVKHVNGVERTLGWRLPGTIFGEVPIALGTPFPGGYRAAEPSRVMRVEMRQYYALAAAYPGFATAMGALARERIGGLQGVAAEAPKPAATIIARRGDPAGIELSRILARKQITFDWPDSDEQTLHRLKPGLAPPAEGHPALLLADGETLPTPSMRQVAERLGLQTIPRLPQYDTLIIGGGPAGLAAAVYGAAEGLRTIVVEREAPGGQAGTSSRIENYLGFPTGVSGDELASRALQQARGLGAEILVTRQIHNLDLARRAALLDGDETVQAHTVILATGVAWPSPASTG